MLYKLDRLSRLHEILRKSAYAILFRMPDWLKYGVGEATRRPRLPYRLLESGDSAIQIGAPWDTLKSGRSRAAYFSRFVGATGKVLAVEPERSNVDALREFANKHSVKQLNIVHSALWYEKARLRFLVDPDHPAANLVEAVLADGREPVGMDVTEVNADSLDNVLASNAFGPIKLLSVTTNGSEKEILQGAVKTLENVEYVSVITPEVGEFLAGYGFDAAGEDDRGYLFRKKASGLN